MKLVLSRLQFSVFLIAAFLVNTNPSRGQARLVIGNTSPVFMNISGGAYLVVGDVTASAASNTIMYTNALARQSWIISEGNGTTNNRVKWFIGNAALGSVYTVPFGRGTTNYIPLTFTIGAAGTAGGPFVFSTYRTATYVNSANLPTTGAFPPTNYYSPSVPGDASSYGVDRFWEIDAQGYGATKPDLNSLIFTYIDGGAGGEVAGVTASNTGLSEANLQAQRWNSTAATPGWQGPGNIFLKGTSTPASDIVTLTGAAEVSGVNDLTTSRWWTLIDNTQPLPVQWLSQSASCSSGSVIVKWSTASEQNADYFTVERSADGTNFQPLANVTASGNSTTIKKYFYIDSDPLAGNSFYRIRETDFNGANMVSPIINGNPCTPDITLNVFPSPATAGGFNIAVTGVKDEKVLIVITDMLGRNFYSKVIIISDDREVIAIDPSNQLAAGVYTVVASSNDNIKQRKIVIQ